MTARAPQSEVDQKLLNSFHPFNPGSPWVLPLVMFRIIIPVVNLPPADARQRDVGVLHEAKSQDISNASPIYRRPTSARPTSAARRAVQGFAVGISCRCTSPVWVKMANPLGAFVAMRAIGRAPAQRKSVALWTPRRSRSIT